MFPISSVIAKLVKILRNVFLVNVYLIDSAVEQIIVVMRW